MSYYLSIDGEKQGPFGPLKVSEMFESGRINRDTLAWEQGMDAWRPIHEVPAFESIVSRGIVDEEPPEIPEESDEASVSSAPAKSSSPPPVPSIEPPTEIRPVTRFWARAFDYTLVSVLVFVFSDFDFPQPEPNEAMADYFTRYLEHLQSPEARTLARVQIFALIAWHFIEGVLIHLVGTTPGKLLFGITVMTEERFRVPLLRSVGRSLFVYVLGVGFYLFPFNVIGMIFSFFRIMSTRKSLWDQQLRLSVETKKLSSVRIILAICAFIALFMLQSAKMS